MSNEICVAVPSLPVKKIIDGVETTVYEPSKLFKSLQRVMPDRTSLLKAYEEAWKKDFQLKNSRILSYDEYGEPTYSSFRKAYKLQIDNEKAMKRLNRELGKGSYAWEEALRRVNYFNASNELADDYMATLKYDKGGQWHIEVVPKSEQAINTFMENMESKYLTAALSDILRQYNVGSIFTEDGSYKGRYDPTNIRRAADGLVYLISLSQQGYAPDVYAEEAGHFTIDALHSSNLVNRLLNILKDKSVQKELLGDLYDTKDLGSNPAKEVAGWLVGQALMDKLTSQQKKHSAMNLVKRIVDFIKSVFRSADARAVHMKIEEARNLAMLAAEKLERGEIENAVENAATQEDIMYSRASSMINKVLEEANIQRAAIENKNFQSFIDAITELEKMSLALSTLNLDPLRKEAQKDIMSSVERISVLQRMTNKTKQGDYALRDLVKVIQTAESIGRDLREYMENSAKVKFTNRQGNYTIPYIKDEEVNDIFKEIRAASIQLRSLKNLYSLVSKYKSDRGAIVMIQRGDTYEEANLNPIIKSLEDVIDSVEQDILSTQTVYYTKFLEKLYGKDIVTMGMHKVFTKGHRESTSQRAIENRLNRNNKASLLPWFSLTTTATQKVSMSSIVTGDGVYLKDISSYASWLSSMQNAGDIAQAISKIAIDKAERQTVRQTETDRMRIAKLEEEYKNIADKSPVKGKKAPWFYKEDDVEFSNKKGKSKILYTTTGYTLYKFDYGKWERALKDFKIKVREDFEAEYDKKYGDGAARELKEFDKDTYEAMYRSYSRRRISRWHKSNSVWDSKNNRFIPNTSDQNSGGEYVIYDDDEYFSKSKEQKQWMDKYYELRRELDKRAGKVNAVEYRAPQYKGTFFNRLENRQGNLISRLSAETFKTFRDTYLWSLTDEDKYVLGAEDPTALIEDTLESDRQNSLLDIDTIPILGIKLRSDPRDLSTKLFPSLLTYAHMVNRKQALDNIVNALEVGKEVLSRRKIENTTEGSAAKGESNSMRAYRRNVDRLLYNKLPHRLQRSKGYHTFHKIMNALKSTGSRLCLAWNPNPAMVNVGTGFVEIMKETSSGEYFNHQDVKKAHELYMKVRAQNMVNMLHGKSFNQSNEDKGDDSFDYVGRFLVYMDVQNNYSERVMKEQKSLIHKLYDDIDYMLYSTGDNYMQAISFLASAIHNKVYDTKEKKYVNILDIYKTTFGKDGKPLSYGFDENRYLMTGETTPEGLRKVLTDIMDLRDSFSESPAIWTKFMDENHEVIENIFQSIQKVYKPEARYIETTLQEYMSNLYWNEHWETKFVEKAREINNRMHGIYSKIDGVPLAGNPYGSSVLSMRGYALGMIERRFASSYFNPMMGDLNEPGKFLEGSYVSAAKLLVDNDAGNPLYNLYRLLLQGEDGLKDEMKDLGYSDNQVANIFRTRVDVYAYTVMMMFEKLFAGLLNAIAADTDDEDDEEAKMHDSWMWDNLTKSQWFLSWMHFLSYKLKNEQGAFVNPRDFLIEMGSLTETRATGIMAMVKMMSLYKDLLLGSYHYLTYKNSNYLKNPYTWDEIDEMTEEQVEEAYKAYKSRNQKLFGKQKDMIALSEEDPELDVTLFDIKPMQKVIKNYPSPFKMMLKMQFYEDQIKSSEFFRKTALGVN